jgi:hypothetical protein
MDLGPRPTTAEMAQLVVMLEERGLVVLSQARDSVPLSGQWVAHLTAPAPW